MKELGRALLISGCLVSGAYLFGSLLEKVDGEILRFSYKINAKITSETVYSPLSNGSVGIDLENDGTLDAVVDFIGARPGTTYTRPPFQTEKDEYRIHHSISV